MANQKLKDALNESKSQENDLGLDLSGINLSDINDINYLIEFLKKYPKFKALSLASTNLTEQGLEKITEFLATDTKIEKIILAKNMLEDKNIAHIVTNLIQKNQTIKEIILSDNGFTSLGAGQIIKAMVKQPKRFARLDLSSNLFIDDKNGVATCGNLLKLENTALKSLDLSFTNITNTTALEVARALAENKTLEYLSLAKLNINKHVIAAITNSLKTNKTLKFLDLSETDIDEEAAIKLVDAVSLSNVECLVLNRNAKLTDKFYSHVIKILDRKIADKANDIFNKRDGQDFYKDSSMLEILLGETSIDLKNLELLYSKTQQLRVLNHKLQTSASEINTLCQYSNTGIAILYRNSLITIPHYEPVIRFVMSELPDQVRSLMDAEIAKWLGSNSYSERITKGTTPYITIAGDSVTRSTSSYAYAR